MNRPLLVVLDSKVRRFFFERRQGFRTEKSRLEAPVRINSAPPPSLLARKNQIKSKPAIEVTDTPQGTTLAP